MMNKKTRYLQGIPEVIRNSNGAVATWICKRWVDWRSRCENKDIEWGLTYQDLIYLLRDVDSRGFTDSRYSPRLHRIDKTKGYLIGNVYITQPQTMRGPHRPTVLTPVRTGISTTPRTAGVIENSWCKKTCSLAPRRPGRKIKTKVDKLLKTTITETQRTTRRASSRLYALRAAAIKYNVPYNLDAQYIAHILQSNTCARSGCTLSKNHKSPLYGVLCRIVPEKGYTKGNVHLVSRIYNTLSSQLPNRVILRLCKGIIQTQAQTNLRQ